MVGGGAHSCERTNGGVCITINADVVLGVTPRANQPATGSQVWHQSNTTATSFAGPCFTHFKDRHTVSALGLCAKELVEGVVSPPSEVAVRGAAELRAAHHVADAKFWLQHESVLHRETREQEAWRGGHEGVALSPELVSVALVTEQKSHGHGMYARHNRGTTPPQRSHVLPDTPATGVTHAPSVEQGLHHVDVIHQALEVRHGLDADFDYGSIAVEYARKTTHSCKASHNMTNKQHVTTWS